MKPYRMNLLCALILVLFGTWGYLGSETPSPTALIPVGFGILFALGTPWLRRENKVVAHILVLLTTVLIIALFMPLRGALNREDTLAAVRIGVMLVSCIAAMIVYIRSFIEARRAR